MPMPSPATLLATSTATAPAFCALRIFVEKVQTPREINAILPVKTVASGAHAVLSPVAAFVGASVTAPNGAVRSLSTVAKSPATPAAVTPPTVIGVPMKCPTDAAPAVKARAADPGDSIVRPPAGGGRPELPAATA